ncbi:hypothetical protein [Ferruginibacter sp.]
MRTLLIALGCIVCTIAGAQTFSLDYKADISKVDKPPFKKSFEYDMSKAKNAKLVITNTPATGLFFYLDGEFDNPIDSILKPGTATVDLSQFEDKKEHIISVKTTVTKKLALVAEITITPKKVTESESTSKPKPQDLWKIVKDCKIKFSLRQFYIDESCCNQCPGCEDTLLWTTDRIIYDALTGKTYFSKATAANDNCGNCLGKDANKSLAPPTCILVNNKHLIKLKANDPFIFQVKNVNPELYDVELVDSSFFMFNQSNDMLEKLLLGKSENFNTESGGDKQKDTVLVIKPECVKAGLILLNEEMIALLENLRVHNRFANNCLAQKRKEALQAINRFIYEDLGQRQYSELALPAFAGMFLEPTEDSSLLSSLVNNYKQLLIGKYELAYRFASVPESDQINFTLKILRKANSPYPSMLNPKTPTQVAYVRNFFKVDVSSGLYYSNFSDDNYTVRADSLRRVGNPNGPKDSLGNRLVPEKMSNGEIGFASYLHFYYKFGTTVNVGGVIGAGVNFADNPQPRYFAGLSFMIGRNNRLCVNAGAAWGYRQKLSDQYYNGKYPIVNDWLPSSETTVKYVKKFECRSFVSISYNLPFLKRAPSNVSSDKSSTPAKSDNEKSTQDTPKTNTQTGKTTN